MTCLFAIEAYLKPLTPKYIYTKQKVFSFLKTKLNQSIQSLHMFYQNKSELILTYFM